MSATKQRTLIIGDIKERVDTLFGASGTTGKWFREVERGPLKPLSNSRNRCTVQDGGQSRVGGGETESGTERKLRVALTLQLAENWDRVSKREDWSDRVEQIINAIHAYIPTRGVIDTMYVDDDPADVMFASGQSNAGWEIMFEVHYFVERN